jgi:hypothetical protein
MQKDTTPTDQYNYCETEDKWHNEAQLKSNKNWWDLRNV